MLKRRAGSHADNGYARRRTRRQSPEVHRDRGKIRLGTRSSQGADRTRSRAAPDPSWRFSAGPEARAQAPIEGRVILVDSSVWIDHLRHPSEILAYLLDRRQVVKHPFIIGELALGHLRPREAVLEVLQDLHQV